MPKKPIEYQKNITIRVSLSQKKRWESFAEDNGFSSLSSLIRYATDELVEGNISRFKNNKETLRQRLTDVEEKYNNLLESQQQIIKAIAIKTTSREENKPLREYQKGLIINLLQEKPRTETEIQKIIPDLSEVEILSIINELIETSIIKQSKNNKFAVI